jgi:siroheme synthase (precorrin-2 oxidase/ferrochelatase)
MCFRFHVISSLLSIGGLAAGVTSEGSGGHELAQLVADHILGHIDGNVLTAIMHSNGMTNEGGEDGGRSGPGLEHLLLAGIVQLLNALVQLRSYKGAFFNASAHLYILLTCCFCA